MKVMPAEKHQLSEFYLGAKYIKVMMHFLAFGEAKQAHLHTYPSKAKDIRDILVEQSIWCIKMKHHIQKHVETNVVSSVYNQLEVS